MKMNKLKKLKRQLDERKGTKKHCGTIAVPVRTYYELDLQLLVWENIGFR